MALATASRDVPRWKSTSGENSKLTSRSVGRPGSNVTTSLVIAGLEESPSPYTSTRSGTPEDSSVQMSTRSIVDIVLAGTRRSPTALRPATRRAGSRLSSAERAPASIRAASAAGTMSLSSGSRMGEYGDQPRCPRLVDVPDRHVVLAQHVGLAGGAEPIDAPVPRVAPPDPEIGVLAEDPGHAAEHRPTQGKLERPLGADLAGPAGGGRAQHLTGQRGCVDVGVLRGPELQQRSGALRRRARAAPRRASAPRGPFSQRTTRRRTDPSATGLRPAAAGRE